MNNPLISIIIPVYNAENYIAECAESLINQTYKNIEIIFADDCSTDSSCGILQQYVEKDSRVKLYSTITNGGPGKARNVGLDNSNGEYIMFCDNDDTYEPNMCEVMLNTMIEKDVDLVTCKSNIVCGKLDRGQEHYVNSNTVGLINLTNKKRLDINVYVWNKLFKKSIIDRYKIKFTTLFAEDILFIYMYVSVIDSIYGLKDKLHNFVLHNASYTQNIGKGRNQTKKWDKLYIIKEYIDFLEKYSLTEERFEYLKTIVQRELFYIFKYYKFSPFEYIKFINKYNSFTKIANKNNELDFYDLYMKYKTPWFMVRMLKVCYWL